MESTLINRRGEEKVLRHPVGYEFARIETQAVSADQFQMMGQMGAMYYEQGLTAKARSIFEEMIRLDPKSGPAHSALGAVLTFIRDDAVALEHLSRAIELDPDEIASYVNRAEVRLRLQDYEPALEDLRIAIEMDPDGQDAGANRARAMLIGLQEQLQALEVSN